MSRAKRAPREGRSPLARSKGRATSDRFAGEYLAELQEGFQAGRRVALFMAVLFCHRERRVAPDWIVDEFAQAMSRSSLMEAKDLGEAFGIAHPKGTHLEAGRENTRLAFAVFADITDARNDGAAVDRALFEAVAKKHHIARSRAEDLYYAVRRQIITHAAVRAMKGLMRKQDLMRKRAPRKR